MYELYRSWSTSKTRRVEIGRLGRKKNEGEKKDTATEGGTRFVAVLIMFI